MNVTENLIKQRIKDELSIDVEQVEHLTIMSVFRFFKNDCHTLEKYPIVEKDISLVETEYYIDKIGYRRIYAIEVETNRFLDINQDTLELVLKTNKQLREMQEDINHLDFFKADNKTISCKKISIEYDSKKEKETVKQIGIRQEWDYTLPSRRKAEMLANKLKN